MKSFKTIAEMENFYYGDINDDMIKKAKAAVLVGDAGYRNVILGAKVWSQINYEANAFAGLPKEPWGKSGWRVETAAGGAFPSGGLSAGSAATFVSIADSTAPTWATITASPKLIDHGFGMNWESYVLNDSDDDMIPISELRRQKGEEHVRSLSAYLIQDADTPAGVGMESLDRVACSSDETANALSVATDGDIYGLDRDAATTYDAQVSYSGTGTAHLRDLTIGLIDGVWNSITKAGGKPDRIFTGFNTLKVWSALLEAERRFNVPDILGSAWLIPRADGASAVTPGTEVGFNVATYFGVPIIPCQDYDSSLATARTGEAAPIMFADTRFLRVAIKMPTVYVESDYPGDTINLDKHGMEGHYYTIGELRCYNFVAQGKVRDIK